MDADKPCRCPRCGWLGTIHDAEAYQPLAHLEPLNICRAAPPKPRCSRWTRRTSMRFTGSTPCC